MLHKHSDIQQRKHQFLNPRSIVQPAKKQSNWCCKQKNDCEGEKCKFQHKTLMQWRQPITQHSSAKDNSLFIGKTGQRTRRMTANLTTQKQLKMKNTFTNKTRKKNETAEENESLWFEKDVTMSNILCSTPVLFLASSAEAELSAFTILGAHCDHECRRSARCAAGRLGFSDTAAATAVGLRQASKFCPTDRCTESKNMYTKN